MAYQFIHVECYCEAPKAVRGVPGHINCAAQVLGEAVRSQRYSSHIHAPRAAIALGGTKSLESLTQLRGEKLAAIRETVNLRNGTSYERRLRRDASTLYTEVHSHPLTVADFLAYPDRHNHAIVAWTKVALADFQTRMPRGIDWAAVMHLDESHVHFHILAINTPDPKLDANKLHAGKRAAAELRDALGIPTAIVSLPRPKLQLRPRKPRRPRPSNRRKTPQKDKLRYKSVLAEWDKICQEIERSNSIALDEWEIRNNAHLREMRKLRGGVPEKIAYIGAMRALQDHYFEVVGRRCGLLRDGPRRARQSTVEYAAREAQLRQSVRDTQEAATLMAFAEAEMARVHSNRMQIEAQRSELSKDQARLAAEKEHHERGVLEIVRRRAEFNEGIAAIGWVLDALEHGEEAIENGESSAVMPSSILTHLLLRPVSNRPNKMFRNVLRLLVRASQLGGNNIAEIAPDCDLEHGM